MAARYSEISFTRYYSHVLSQITSCSSCSVELWRWWALQFHMVLSFFQKKCSIFRTKNEYLMVSNPIKSYELGLFHVVVSRKNTLIYISNNPTGTSCHNWRCAFTAQLKYEVDKLCKVIMIASFFKKKGVQFLYKKRAPNFFTTSRAHIFVKNREHAFY